MKILTVILIVLFITALVVLGSAISRFASSSPEPVPAKITEEDQEADEEEYQNPVIETEEEPSVQPEVPEEKDPWEVSSVEIYLDGNRDSGIFLGEAEYGQTSVEAADIYGDDFSDIGFYLSLEQKDYSFTPGSIHFIYIYVLIPEHGWSYLRQKLVIPGTADVDGNIRLSIDDPPYNQEIKREESSSIKVSGWTVDMGKQDSTGIDRVEVYINGPRGFGWSLGETDYGIERQDVANALSNAAYTYSGYSLIFDGSRLDTGVENTLYIYSFSTSGRYNMGIRDILIEGKEDDSAAIISAETSLSGGMIQVRGWAVDKELIAEGRPRDIETAFSIKKIIFTSTQTGDEELFSMEIDGSGLVRLTDHPGKDNYPSVSPDGKRIAYTSEVNGTWQIMVMNWDGTDKVQLTSNPWRSAYPTWSFDGRYIFFEAYPDGDWEIYRMNSDGSNIKRLTINPNIDDWHPYGHPFQYKVLYESGSRGNEEIYIMDDNGKNVERVSGINMRKRVPAISADGDILVIMGYEGSNSVIRRIDLDEESTYIISGDLKNCGHPAISPDMQYVTFESPDGQGEIYIVNLDGSGLTRLTDIPGNDYDPVFLYQKP